MPNPGRKKTTASGTASVHKTGSGIGSSKPVGHSGGYSGNSGNYSHSSSSSNSGSSHSSSGSYSNKSYSTKTYSTGTRASGSTGLLGGLIALIFKNKTTRMIAIIALLLLVFYFMRGGSCSGCLSVMDGSSSVGSLFDSSSSYSTSSGLAGETADDHTANSDVSLSARDKRTVIAGNGDDVYTIMVYMCGADLESRSGMATSDLKEMIAAKTNDKINLIVETGGASKWQNSTVSNSTNQLYRVTSDGMIKLGDLGKKAMTDPATLSEFIQYAAKSFPADRYALIFWDHGGGSVSGYGYDELYPNGSMTLDKINTALSDGGVNFDFIGFDACLMATLENALVCERHADYLIASEETEPGVGWYYTNWLTKLANNTSMSTVEIGKNIIDDFVEKCGQMSSSSQTTLSITDLAELAGTVPESFTSFAQSTSALIDSDNYQQVSNARSSSKEFQSGLNQVDLIDLATKMGTDEGNALAKALKSAIKYNRTSRNVSNANGLTIFFPYGKTSNMSTALKTFDKIGLDDSYCDCIKSFASVSGGGQIAAGTGGSLTDALFGGSTSDTTSVSGGSLTSLISLLGGSSSTSSSSSSADLISTALQLFLSNRNSASLTGINVGQDEEWFDAERVEASTDYYAEHSVDPGKLVATEDENGDKVIDLEDSEWELIQNIYLNVFVDDGEGYIDLGMDNVYETNDSGDLRFDYDNTWLTINRHVIAYYMTSYEYNDAGDYCITGRSPILLNGERADLILRFDNENEDGLVMGARIVYDEGETEAMAKGLIELKEGDAIDFLCDYYAYDQSYQDSYLLGERMIVGADLEMQVANMNIGTDPKRVTYCLEDIYGNELWADALNF